jgi:glycosyltransferase involved in cell wall biosynthesis
LAAPGIEVLGFVRDIDAVYASSDIFVVPMRYGGGLKGKIVEAMSRGLPVVTNTICLEGFTLVPTKEVLVGDSPLAFAAAVLTLLRDSTLYQSLREAGWNHVRAHFSEEVVATTLREVLVRSRDVSPRKLRFIKRLAWSIKACLDRYVWWRFRNASHGST